LARTLSFINILSFLILTIIRLPELLAEIFPPPIVAVIVTMP
jgi:hypothetical protein